jgi:hypothetical protein
MSYAFVAAATAHTWVLQSDMNIQPLGIGSNLHSFADDERQERRQYPRVELRFALWWLKDLRGSEPVP